MENIGFLAALGAAVCWGSYMVPFKKSGSQNLILFQALMATGIGISGLLLALGLSYSLNINPYGLLSGVLWAIANAIFLVAVANLGIARAVPLSSALVIVSSFIWGAVVFREMSSGIITGFIGIGLIILGVILVSIVAKAESQNAKMGLMAAVTAGMIWGSQLAPLKVGKVATEDFFFSLCVGILVTGLLIAVFLRVKFRGIAFKESLISGVIWNVGNLLSLLSLSLIGLAKMGPISQSSILVAVIWGLFYFKEVTKYKLKLQILVGAIILLSGVIILGLA